MANKSNNTFRLIAVLVVAALAALIPLTYVLAGPPPDDSAATSANMTAEQKTEFLARQKAKLGGSVASVNEETKRVGVEWVEDYTHAGLNYLQYSAESAGAFYDRLGTAGWTKCFNYGNSSAWEEDFKESAYDDVVADSVDIVWFEGHGASGRLAFGDLYHDDLYLYYNEASWGDNQLEWVFLKSCSVLAGEGDGDSLYKSGGQFAQALQGAHMICGCGSIVVSAASDGENVAEYLTGQDGKTAQKVWRAWGKALKDTQDATDQLIAICESSYCIDDYIWDVSTGPAYWPGVDTQYYGLWWQAGDS